PGRLGLPRPGGARPHRRPRRGGDRRPHRPARLARRRPRRPPGAGGALLRRGGCVTASSIGFAGVAASLVLVVAAAVLSWREGLGLERSIAWAACRAFVQLVAIGGALALVLADDAPLALSWLWVVGMVVVGAVTIASRVP